MLSLTERFSGLGSQSSGAEQRLEASLRSIDSYQGFASAMPLIYTRRQNGFSRWLSLVHPYR